MNRITVLILALLPLFSLAQKPVKIEGEIINSELKEITLIYDPMYLGRSLEVKTPVVNGKFSVGTTLPEALFAGMKIGDASFNIFIEPGDEFMIRYDAKSEKEKISFSGQKAAQNSFYLAFQRDFATVHNAEEMKKKVQKESVDEIELYLYDQRKKMTDAFNTATGNKEFSEEFRKFMDSEIKLSYDRWLLGWSIERSNAQTTNTKVQHLPGTIEKDMDRADVMTGFSFYSDTYRDYLRYYITYFASKKNQFLKFTDYNSSAIAKAEYAGTALKDVVYTWYLADFMFLHCGNLAPGTKEKMLGWIKAGKNGKDYSTVCQLKCEELLAQSTQSDDPDANPDEKYKFRMVDLDGNPRYLSEFKGKVVYVDFWASWCGPCKQQMPYAAQLKERVHNELSKKQQKDLVFLYISIDQNEEAWRNALEKLNIQGEHAWSNGRWSNGAGAYFGIPSIPRYMIIGKDGEIVNRSAKRPSQPEIFDELVKLL